MVILTMEVPTPSSSRTSLQSAVHKCVDNSLQSLSAIWHDIGLSEEAQCERTKAVLDHIQGLLEEMNTEEEDCRTKLKEGVRTLQLDYAKLCSQMSVSEIQFDAGLTLLTLDTELRSNTSLLQKEKTRRIQQMNKLKAEEKHSCSRLHRPCQISDIGSDQVPTLKQLDAWTTIVEEVRSELESRSERLLNLQRAVQSLWLQLEIDPGTSSSDLECVLNMDDGVEKLPLTDETENNTKSLASKLENALVALVANANSLRSQISCLYGRLEVPAEDQQAFLGKHGDCRPTTVDVLQAELDRLEDLKRQHMSAFIQTVRNELHDLWEQLMFGTLQREQFAPAYSEAEASEEMLSAHEAEAERLKQYIADTADIYKLVAKREDLWTRMQELLASANNPNRYNNRGGQLLKEEKMRKAISKELPKVEKELQAAVEAFETKTSQTFMIKDERYLDAIATQWEGLQSKKDTDKTKRTQKGKEDVPPSHTATTPHKRRAAATPSGNHNPAKRRVIPTSSSASTRGPQTTFVQSKTPGSRVASAGPSGRHVKAVRVPLKETNDMEASMAIAGNIGNADCTIGSIAALDYKEFEQIVPQQARCSSMGRANEIPALNLPE